MKTLPRIEAAQRPAWETRTLRPAVFVILAVAGGIWMCTRGSIVACGLDTVTGPALMPVKQGSSGAVAVRQNRLRPDFVVVILALCLGPMSDEGHLVESSEHLGTWGSGTQVADAVLLDGVVRKTAGPWTPAVFALLKHLEHVGFAGAPRVVGDGYSFVPGESPHPHAWSDEAVGAVGTLLRGLHDATATFTPPAGAVWQVNWLRQLGGDDIVIGHCDPGPWNIVGEHGRPDAFIDWEFAGPVDRLWELAETVWLNAQLVDDDVAEMQGLPDALTRARHARAIVDGYGLPRTARDELVDRLADVAIHNARHEAVAQGVTIDSTTAIADDGYPILWGITWRARSASWIARHRNTIRQVMLK